ncbi:ARM repeat-containing protein [Rickenella mellea]|uniref:ARM repeat-containing protein n=1 Tax=Rickenella mellea TaxID=50990 RepID=A0A4Y7QI77_9AGAM|nr:ARM repeat-containing protein [Rickenella mellea]
MVSILAFLKQTKNSIIGNPTAKVAFHREGAVSTYFANFIVEYVNVSPDALVNIEDSAIEIRTEAAHVITSLASGSKETLHSLLAAGAHEAILWAISELQPNDPPSLRTALARTLRALATSYAEIVGPSLWGLGEENNEIQSEARSALDSIFETQSLDIYLPLISDPSPVTRVAICQLISNAVRQPEHRKMVAEWVPMADRAKESKGKRGWEKPGVGHTHSSVRVGGWITQTLSALLRSKEPKLQEAALSALAALAKDTPSIGSVLAKPSTDREGATSSQPSALFIALTLCKSRQVNLQLAACLCATRIIRSNNNNRSTDITPAWTLLHVLNNIISDVHEHNLLRAKACFVLFALSSDQKEICRAAVKSGSLAKLSDLIKSITITEDFQDWGDSEPESTSKLREAALTAVSALALFDNEIRHEITSVFCLIPHITVSLSHPQAGVRYAACQCVRAISRAVAVLRTSIVDSGVGLSLYKILENRDEDRRVSAVALAGICNLVNNFSPLRSTLINKGLIPRLAELTSSPYHSLKLNALWAVKNLVHKCTPEDENTIMEGIGWERLGTFLYDPNMEIREQALNILCNIASSASDIEMIFGHLGYERTVDALNSALGCPDEGVLCQGINCLANIANGSAEQRAYILSCASILNGLRNCLTHSKLEVRQAAVSCVRSLVQGVPQQHKEVRDARIDITLRHIVGSVVPTSPSISGHVMGVEEDAEVRKIARLILDLLERPE